MKEITAIIRMNKMNQTKQALAEAGIASLTARKVMGRGKGKVDYLLLRGAEEGYEEAINQLGPGPKLIPKRMLTIVVEDDLVDLAVETIIEVNKTGNPGDGKIFILPMLDAVRVRTGEMGEEAIDGNTPDRSTSNDLAKT
jgi:nitrogen regulatory protein PII 2